MSPPRRHDSPLTPVASPPGAVGGGGSGALEWLGGAAGGVAAWVGLAGAAPGVMGLSVSVMDLVSPGEGKKASHAVLGW